MTRRVIPGHVSLVGAGPGAADLLTVRAVTRLREADLVLYDALVTGEVLDLAPGAIREFVGRRSGETGTPVAAIVARMVEAAREGLRVVRLKGGDPFVLARGGEEATGLMEAGIPFEVVPGLTSAVAAPVLAGIPLTRRGLASSFLVVSGHHPDAWRTVLESLPPRGTTLVVLMGLAARTHIAAALRARGWPDRTPAAVLLDMSTPREWVWRGTLQSLATLMLHPDRSEAPGVLVIGETASLPAPERP